jgi:DNA invertase Pin-like site-specific DNA recombinase
MAKRRMTAAIYARVSTEDQQCEMQLTELRSYVERMGWEALEYVEKASGKAGAPRPELERLLADARLKRFGAVVVWKLDRFGRSLQEFVERVMLLDQLGIRFIAPSQGIDTDRRSPAGKLLMHILAAIAEFERELIRERVRAGIAEAQRRGKHCGRPLKVFRRDEALRMRRRGMSWRAIARALGVPQSTVRLAVRRALEGCAESPPQEGGGGKRKQRT